ncbi:MAG: nucleoside transporter C-terminal domain-containing protein [Ectothiorhodospiraceae bacterium]|nr:nucleoside transporter C-terminal domain-containing protein [Ectothiorhodospiraceae bacterium]
MLQLQSLFGLLAFTFIAWLLSENRRAVRPRLIFGALALQIALALLLLKFPPAQALFLALNKLVLAMEESTRAGTSLVFGYLGGGDLPFDESSPGAAYILAFRGLPMVLVVSALSALLFYWRILPLLVRAMAWVLQRTLNIGGALGVAVTANVFVGMTEAPLLIRPYLMQLTRSELFAVMVSGMATIAGTMMVLYASILGPALPDALGQILTASLISAPAAVMVALVMIPETHAPTAGSVTPGRGASGTMDAVTHGTIAGLQLLLNIIAMLVVLVALVHLANLLLGLLPAVAGETLTLQRLLGWMMAPVVWLMGVPWREAVTGGSLMGVKTILNEFVAYLDLANLPADALSPRSRVIMTYALCGFANLGSLGIMIGGLGTMVPERRTEIVALGFRSIVAGTLATLMTGAVAGLLFG